MSWNEGTENALEDITIGVKEPDKYQVVMLNDDYTTQDFVVEVLSSIFDKSFEEAHKIMWEVHYKGRAVVGIYSYDMAVSKVKQTFEKARKEEFPLRCVIQQV